MSLQGVELPIASRRWRAYERLAGRVRLLSWLSLAWMTIEGGVAIAAGLVAGSIALIGFGLDSAIEGFASVIIVWRFSGARMFSDQAEQRAQKAVAIQFFLLAPYVAFESARALLGGARPEESWVGIGLAISSVILMPLLGIAKQRLAVQLGSAATKGEGRQNMLCAYLAAALLLGLLGNALAGAWWLDPVVGLADRRGGGQGGPRRVARRGLRLLRLEVAERAEVLGQLADAAGRHAAPPPRRGRGPELAERARGLLRRGLEPAVGLGQRALELGAQRRTRRPRRRARADRGRRGRWCTRRSSRRSRARPRSRTRSSR